MKERRFLAVLLLATLALATAFAANPEEPSIPQRVISCAPHLTEIAFALGAGERVIAADDHSRFPPEADKLPKIGGLFAPNLERMIALRPDALLLAPSNRDVRDFFSGREGVRLIECNDANSVASIRGTIQQLAEVFGRPEEARRLLAAIDSAFSQIEARVRDAEALEPHREKPSVLLLLSRRPGELNNLYAFHPDAYLGDLVGRLGFRNVIPQTMPLYPQITLEHILAWNPDVIVEVQGDDAFTPAAEARLREDWRRLPTLRANREGGVILLSGKSLTIPGPRVGETFAKLAVRLRPDVFSMSEEELLAEARTTTEIKKE